jgi:hypothetical protein
MAAVVEQVQAIGVLATFGDEGTVHHRNRSMSVRGLLKQLSIECGKVAKLVELSPVGALTHTAVAAQIAEVDLAADDDYRTQQSDEELRLRFAKPPTFSSKVCTIAIGLFIRCLFCSICTLEDE